MNIYNIVFRVSYLNVFLVSQQRCFHDVSQSEVLRFKVKRVFGCFGNAVPVPVFHCFVGHHLQQGAALVEVINLLLQIQEGLPVFEAFWQLAAPAE